MKKITQSLTLPIDRTFHASYDKKRINHDSINEMEDSKFHPMDKKTTLKDIAAICNCSVTTVSRALKKSPTISKAMQQRVSETAQKLGYIPNSLATSMRTGSTNTIAACLQDFRNPFFAAIAKYIESYSRKQGYFSLFTTTNEQPSHEYEVCKSLLEKNVDGILFFPIQRDTKAVELLIQQHIPLVLVGRYFDEIDTDYVISDDAQGAYLVTKHLISKNAKNILFMNVSNSISSARNREIGYLRALCEHGLTPHVLEGSMEYGKTREAIMDMADSLRHYDAIITFCDIMGFEAYHTLSGMGYRIPSDIMLASLDGLQQDIILPIELTCAGTNRRLMVEKSVNLLLDKIKGCSTDEKQHIMIEQYLLEGSTT